MSYATNADLEQRLGPVVYVQLTDDEGSGSAHEGRVSEAREAAEAEIDSHLGRRYAVPVALAAHPELAALLRSLTLDLAEFRLHARRPPVPEDVRRKHEAALKWLSSIGSGVLVLPAASELAGSTTRGPLCEAIGPARLLSREEMENL